MADNGSTDDWSDILSERVGQERAKTPAAETQTSGDSAGGTPPPDPAAEEAAEEAAIEPASRSPPPPPPPRAVRTPAAERVEPELARRRRGPDQPGDGAPRPATGPRGHHTGTVHGGRPQPLDSLGPDYGGITTGWKVPATGGLPRTSPTGGTAVIPASSASMAAVAVPGATPIPGSSAPGRSAGTSAELVVRDLTRQMSARQETRAINILRGRAGTGSGPGLAAIIVLSAAAVFAGTYLWTQAVRERGALRVDERDLRAPEETELAVAETGPATLGTRTAPPAEKKTSPVVVKKTPPERPRRVTPVSEQPASKEPRRDPVEPEDDDAPLFVIEAPAPSSGGPEGPLTDEWAELGGPLFE